MIRREEEGVSLLEFDLFRSILKLTHGVFLRNGGYSQGAFDSLNMSLTSGDCSVSVERNRKKVQRLLKVKSLALMNQCHTSTCKVIRCMSDQKNILIEDPCDAMITDQKDIGLMVLHADCQAALFYDRKKEVIAAVHAGWRGSVHNIYAATIETLKREYGCDPRDLLVGISPSLGPNAAEFINYKKELPENFFMYQIKPNYFDFWSISLDQLISAGVLKQHIEIAKICTFSHPEDYFSYRRDKATGRHATVIGMLS